MSSIKKLSIEKSSIKNQSIKKSSNEKSKFKSQESIRSAMLPTSLMFGTSIEMQVKTKLRWTSARQAHANEEDKKYE